MKISQLSRKVLHESFVDISVDKLGISDVVSQADQAIDDTPAGQAIDSFVGVPRTARDQGLWGGVMHSRELEDAWSETPSSKGLKIRQTLQKAFAPVRRALQAKFGDRITLYRAQAHVRQPAPTRTTLSWTSDPRVAAYFAGIDPRLMKIKPISDQDIQQALDTYTKTGRVKWLGKTYQRTDTATNDSNLDEFYYEIYDRDGEMLTDGDDLSQQFREDQQYYQELISKRDARLAKVVKAEIPIGDIIWITDRAGQSEFILHNRTGARGYIDAQGRKISS